MWLWKKQELATSIMVLIVSGALGNGLDRLMFHGVRDFLDFHVRPVFNLADIYLSLAVIVVLYLSLVKKHA
jgi:signal peptidase II